MISNTNQRPPEPLTTIINPPPPPPQNSIKMCMTLHPDEDRYLRSIDSVRGGRQRVLHTFINFMRLGMILKGSSTGVVGIKPSTLSGADFIRADIDKVKNKRQKRQTELTKAMGGNIPVIDLPPELAEEFSREVKERLKKQRESIEFVEEVKRERDTIRHLMIGDKP